MQVGVPLWRVTYARAVDREVLDLRVGGIINAASIMGFHGNAFTPDFWRIGTPKARFATAPSGARPLESLNDTRRMQGDGVDCQLAPLTCFAPA